MTTLTDYNIFSVAAFDCTAYFQKMESRPLKPLPTLDVFFSQSGQNADPQIPGEVPPGSLCAVAHTVSTYRKAGNPKSKATLSLNLHAIYVLLSSEK